MAFRDSCGQHTEVLQSSHENGYEDPSGPAQSEVDWRYCADREVCVVAIWATHPDGRVQVHEDKAAGTTAGGVVGQPVVGVAAEKVGKPYTKKDGSLPSALLKEDCMPASGTTIVQGSSATCNGMIPDVEARRSPIRRLDEGSRLWGQYRQ